MATLAAAGVKPETLGLIAAIIAGTALVVSGIAFIVVVNIALKREFARGPRGPMGPPGPSGRPGLQGPPGRPPDDETTELPRTPR